MTAQPGDLLVATLYGGEQRECEAAGEGSGAAALGWLALSELVVAVSGWLVGLARGVGLPWWGCTRPVGWAVSSYHPARTRSRHDRPWVEVRFSTRGEPVAWPTDFLEVQR